MTGAAAREALGGMVGSQPSEGVCLLMAEIEEGEHGDQGRVRAWLARALGAPRDPAWIADGRVFSEWAPISPVSGRVDAFEWKVPPARLPAERQMEIEAWATASEPPPGPRSEGGGGDAGCGGATGPGQAGGEPTPVETKPAAPPPAETASRWRRSRPRRR